MLQLAFVNFKKGSYILIEGKPFEERFYIIQSGKAQCFKTNDVSNQENALVGPGDFLGVIPCMAFQSQIENVIAVTDVVVIAVRRDQYTELIKNNTPVAMKIIKQFAERMRIMNETLTQLTLKSTIIVSSETLYIIANYYEKAGRFSIAAYDYYQYIKACPDGQKVDTAKQHLAILRNNSNAVYLEPSQDSVRIYPKDTMIFSECQAGNDMFIIQDGEVTITKFVNDNEVVLAILKKGDIFGEMALLENKPRSASAIAHTNCTLMVVNRQNFNQMVSTQPQMIFKLTTTLADRLWALSRQLENTQIKDPVNKLLDMLALQIEKTKSHANEKSYQTDITLQELCNMCGFLREEQAGIMQDFSRNMYTKENGGKIFIKDVAELLKFSSFTRKQR